MRWQQNGFGLVELMIVVSIVALLAAIAIPRYAYFASRSRRTEGVTVLKGLYVAETSYFSSEGTYASQSGGGYPAHLGYSVSHALKSYDLSTMVISADTDLQNPNHPKINFEIMLSGQIDGDIFIAGPGDDWLQIYAQSCPSSAVFCTAQPCRDMGVVNVAIDDLYNRFMCI